MSAASTYSNIKSYVLAAISCAFRNNSVTKINDAKDVSFTRLINVFDNGGIDTLAACGKIIRRSV